MRDLGNFASAGEKRFMLTKYLHERDDRAVREVSDLISKSVRPPHVTPDCTAVEL